MSDGAIKPDEDTSAVKRAGRARICKECRFTTTDVREFSRHRQHAHAEENNEDNKSVTRRNSLKRKPSASEKADKSDKTNSATVVEEQSDTKNKIETETKVEEVIENKKEETIDQTNKTEDSENKTKDQTEEQEEMASEQISDELLSSLALAPRKQVNNIEKEQRPKIERTTIERMNGHSEEVVLYNHEEEQDDESRLVIAEDSENGDDHMDLNSSDGLAPSRGGNIQNRTYMCGNCEFSTTSAKLYLHHQRDVHNSGILIYECDICDYATKYKQKLPRHRKLHFLGKDGLFESDMDNSLTERELKELKDNASLNMDHMNGEEDIDDDGELDEDEEEEMVTLSSTRNSLGTPTGAPIEKKKRIRQEVDPLKYYEVVDDIGVKYACSKCGNVYKWRKSLNKHWKEKHFGETPDLTNPPATLQNYTLYSRYKAKYGGQPPPPAAPNVVYGAAAASPANQIKNRSTPTSTSKPDDDLPMPTSTPSLSLSNVVMPRQIGPFIGGTNQNSQMSNPVVTMASYLSLQHNRTPDSHHDVRQMIDGRLLEKATQLMKQQQQARQNQREPIDFSKPLDFSKKSDSSVKSEPSWGDTNSESDSLSEMPISMMVTQANNQIAAAMKQDVNSELDPAILRCTKCNFTAKTLVDYSAHMSLHLNKRAFKCAECQSHFSGIDELNKHFLDTHSEKIQEHKEAIQKIPHGLQQTYHLLKMPLDSISGLSSQELLSNEPKQLKCSMCNFVAKWPAELQKHAVSHSEERPFVCMVCGSTYKWKWDLVKHFEKSHSSLPNPYKRREGGGVLAVNSSPATPPLDAISKSTSALMEGMNQHYIMEEEAPPSKKRRLSEHELQEAEDYYRELLERQVRARREMSGIETPPHLKLQLQQNRAAFSDPILKSTRDLMQLKDDQENQTPKRNVHEALKQRLNSGKHMEEEVTPQKDTPGKNGKGSEVVLPYKCTVCEYRARWPSEISQHMKNHSNEKPFHCPRCSYKSKWKWDVVKHLRRCGGGTVHDVIDTTKLKKMAPPNVMVMPLQPGQHNAQQSHQHQKTSQNQPVFPSNQRASSLSPAMSASSSMKSLAANFSMGAGGQEHPESMDLSGDNSGKSPVFRSLVNQGMHYCLECPFVGNSPTELRRHAMLHSDTKPFACQQCGYSSRWKCDLKKHMKTYGHFNNTVPFDSGDDNENNSDQQFEEADDSDDDNKSTLYMCPQCPYNSYKKNAYEHHLRIHGSMMEESPKSDQKDDSNAKFKCSKCDFRGNDLSSFLHHKRSHNQADEMNGGNRESPEPWDSRTSTPIPQDVSNRTIHLKQRRKPVKQFRCERCPYICFKKSSLDVHDAMHIPRGSDTFLCMFCDYNVFSKSLLLQHMRLHPEYNPAECSEADGKVTAAELTEMEELEEREINSDDSKSMSAFEDNSADGFQSNDSAIDFSRGPSSNDDRTTPVNFPQTETKNASPSNNNNTILNNNNEKSSPTSGMNLPCEWCSATFPNVVALYQHSQTLHPQQLKAQEAGDIAASQAPGKGSQLEQIVRDRQREYQVYHQFMARQQPQIQLQIQTQLQAQAAQATQDLVRKYVPLAPKTVPQPTLTQNTPQQTTTLTQLDVNIPGTTDSMNISPSQLSPNQLAAMRARKSVSQQKKARSFQCTKCTFTAPNAVTYLRHIERHGSNCKHTCLYCDYSIDRLNLLYQHMKGTHGTKWQGTTEEKISLSVHSEDSNNNIIENMGEDDTEQLNSSFNDFAEGIMEGNGISETGALSEFNLQGIKPILAMQEETQWRGIPLHICTLDGKKHYKCPKCMYININASNTAYHYQQHGQNRKYRCSHCDYSVDNVMTMQHHLENIHTKEPKFIPMPARTSVLIDDFPQEINTKPESGYTKTTNSGNSGSTQHACPKCPYKTTEKVKLQIHLERHNRSGRYECQLCDYSVDQYAHLRHHAKLHHTKFLPGQQGDDIVTNIEKSFEDQEFAKRWTANNLPEKSSRQQVDKICYKCARCPFFTYKKSGILKHRLQHVNKSPFACQKCTFSTNVTNELEEHVQIHDGLLKPSGQFLEFILDPFSEMYKVLEKFPDDLQTTDVEEADNNKITIDDEDDDEFAMETDDVEDDVEAAMMEEELRDTISGSENLETRVEKNLDGESAFDTDIQFRNYKCADCPYSSNSNAEYTKHLRLHGADKKFKCDYCSYSLERVNLVSQHRKLHFQEKDFESAPAMAKLLNKNHEEYETMLVKVGNEIAYPPVESISKVQEDNIDSFLYQKVGDEKNRYACNKCPYRCQALKSFKCHMQMHGITRKYRCDYCDWSAERLNLLIQHRRVHNGEKGFDAAPGEITFLNREFLLESENAYDGVVRMAAMDYQDSPFTGSDLSKSPKKNAAGEKIYYCKLCPFRSENMNTYSYHKKLHCIQAMYSCSECSYSINNFTSLKEHQNLHQKERELIKASFTEGGVKHKCPKCPYSSANKNLLVNHTSMHSSGRKHECNQCDFSSDTQALLQLHLKVHEDGYTDSDALAEMELLMKRSPNVIGPQLYLSSSNSHDLDSDCSESSDPDHKCEKCPFSTPSKDELGSHNEHHTARGKSSCRYCTFSCSKEEELISHVQVHFPSTTIDKDMLKQLKRMSHKRNISKAFGDADEKNTMAENRSVLVDGEPDSTTVTEPVKDMNTSDEQNDTKPKDCKDVEKTKVYVCQFCEREFDDKINMLHHEKQHLVGSKF